MYLGDDATDEDAFRVIEAYGNGISVYVGEPTSTSAAAYFVRSPDEVAAFLEAFLNASRQAFAHGQPLPSEKPCGDGQVPCGGYTCEAESD
jgi:trehalose-6-phosphatase